MRNNFLALLISIPIFCFSQKQENIWYFGDHAGVDFNSGVPVALSNGQTYLSFGHSEGTAGICDSSGSLLFYTNGDKIWNRNHQVMQNGDSILSSFSSTQSSLIIPKPGSDNLFYLFTTDAFYQHNLQYGFRYSIIDMCKDSSLGAVNSEAKNILLLDTVAEKLTGVRHKNGSDYWVIIHKYFSDAFYAYRLSNTGVIDTVITHIGSVHRNNCIPVVQDSTISAIGYMKASPDGKRLAVVSLNNCDNIKELFDFSDSSGVVSNYIDLDLQPDTFGGYGLSFSPDNSKLYFTDLKNVFQYDLSTGSGNQDSIRSSKFQITNFTSMTNDYSDGLQLGPDGKIYIGRAGKHFLASINNPNLSGVACNFQDSVIYLNTGDANYGLPNLIDSYSYSNTTLHCSTGIFEFSNEKYFYIYPNPTQSNFTIKINGDVRNVRVEIYNVLGENLYTSTLNSKSETINKKFPSGIYFVKVTDDTKQFVEKLIVQ